MITLLYTSGRTLNGKVSTALKTTFTSGKLTLINTIVRYFLLFTLLHVYAFGNAQTEKGTYSLLLHNFSPSGIKIDGLPVNIFPQTSGLGFSFGSHKTKLNGRVLDVKEKVMTFGLSLSGQYFLFNNFSFGLTGNYFSGTTTYSESEKPDEKYSTTMLMGGGELRYYIPAGPRLKYWLKASPVLGFIESKYDGKEVHVPKRLYEFSGGAGVSYFPSRSTSIDLGVTYNVCTIRNKGNYSELSRKEYIDSVGLDIGFSIFF